MTMPINILLLGASGIPGRYILSSLLKHKQNQSDVNITVVKRSTSSSSAPTPAQCDIAYLDDFSDTTTFVNLLSSLKPSIIISALNAEPAPILDNLVIEAILEYQNQFAATESSSTPKLFYINGYTLDLLHPSVSSLPDEAKVSLIPKLDFAARLRSLASEGKLEYCTIVNASFLDYCLVKGYSAIDWNKQAATLIDGGDARLTGCSLDFVGDVVALVAQLWSSGSEEARAGVRNRRLRVAETVYSGQQTVDVVERITGRTFDVEHTRSEDVLVKGSIIRYLNWNGLGSADFSDDGLEFGREVLNRRTLEEICEDALAKGVAVFDGVGR